MTKLWIEVDGKLRDPEIDDVRDWLWLHHHCVIITDGLAKGYMALGKEAARLVGDKVPPP